MMRAVFSVLFLWFFCITLFSGVALSNDSSPNDLAMVVIVDSPRSVDKDILSAAKDMLGKFFSVAGENIDVSLITINGNSIKVVLPLGKASALQFNNAINSIRNVYSKANSSIFPAYKIGADILKKSDAKAKGIIIITSGDRKCSNEKEFCMLSSKYRLNGINTLIIRYLIDEKSSVGSFTCGGTNIFYGIDANTSENGYSRRFLRTLFRARRELLLSANVQIEDIGFDDSIKKCLLDKLGRNWILMEMSEVRGDKNKKYWITIESAFTIMNPKRFEAMGRLGGFGLVKAGAEDLYKKDKSGGIDDIHYYLDDFPNALNECKNKALEDTSKQTK